MRCRRGGSRSEVRRDDAEAGRCRRRAVQTVGDLRIAVAADAGRERGGREAGGGVARRSASSDLSYLRRRGGSSTDRRRAWTRFGLAGRDWVTVRLRVPPTRPLLSRTAPAAAPAPPMAILRSRARRSPVDRSAVCGVVGGLGGVAHEYCSCGRRSSRLDGWHDERRHVESSSCKRNIREVGCEGLPASDVAVESDRCR